MELKMEYSIEEIEKSVNEINVKIKTANELITSLNNTIIAIDESKKTILNSSENLQKLSSEIKISLNDSKNQTENIKNELIAIFNTNSQTLDSYINNSKDTNLAYINELKDTILLYSDKVINKLIESIDTINKVNDISKAETNVIKELIRTNQNENIEKIGVLKDSFKTCFNHYEANNNASLGRIKKQNKQFSITITILIALSIIVGLISIFI